MFFSRHVPMRLSQNKENKLCNTNFSNRLHTNVRVSVPFRTLLACFSTQQGLNPGCVSVPVDDKLTAPSPFGAFISSFLHPHVNELLMIPQAHRYWSMDSGACFRKRLLDLHAQQKAGVSFPSDSRSACGAVCLIIIHCLLFEERRQLVCH